MSVRTVTQSVLMVIGLAAVIVFLALAFLALFFRVTA